MRSRTARIEPPQVSHPGASSGRPSLNLVTYLSTKSVTSFFLPELCCAQKDYAVALVRFFGQVQRSGIVWHVGQR